MNEPLPARHRIRQTWIRFHNWYEPWMITVIAIILMTTTITILLATAIPHLDEWAH